MKDNMNNFSNQHWNQNQQNTQQQNNQNQQQPNNQVNQQQPSMIMKLMSSCLPVLLEQFTGQAMPAMGGNNNPEIQFMLSQVLNAQQQIVNSLQELTGRLSNLETRASQQFTGLSQQIQNFKSVRLTHDRERKQIELGTNQFNQNSENNNYD